MKKDDYLKATWRGTLPVDRPDKTIAISFDSDRGTIRLRLGVECAEKLSESIYEYIHSTSQKDKSSGMFSSPGSTPDEGQKV